MSVIAIDAEEVLLRADEEASGRDGRRGLHLSAERILRGNLGHPLLLPPHQIGLIEVAVVTNTRSPQTIGEDHESRVALVVGAAEPGPVLGTRDR